LATKEDQAKRSESERSQLIDRLRAELAPLERFDAAMRSAPAQAGTPFVQLLGRAVALDGKAPDLPPRQRELLPMFHFWHAHATSIERLRDHLRAVQADGILANHPLRRLHSRFGQVERPLQVIHDTLPKVNGLLDKLLGELRAMNLPADCWDTLERLGQLGAYAQQLLFLAEHDLLGLLAAKSDPAKRLATHRKKLANKAKELERAQTATTSWRQKLSPEDTITALQQMRSQENSFARFFSPAWWRLRGLLRNSYDFASHQVQPSYSHVLELLKNEHEIAADLEKLEFDARDEYFFEGPFRDFSARVAALADGVDRLPTFLQTFHRHVLTSSSGDAIVQNLAALTSTITRLQEELASLLAGAKDLSLEQIRAETKRVEASLDDLPAFAPCLKELGAMPAPLADAWRSFPFQADQLEANWAASLTRLPSSPLPMASPISSWHRR
jgi:hypothetical protein